MGNTDIRRDEFFQELKRIRESKGLTLEEVARRYRIRPSFLESIESGTFDALPEPVYTRIFIKTYAGILGVDAAPILARYEKHVEMTMPAPQPQAAKEKAGETLAGKAASDWLTNHGKKLGWAVLALAVVIALGVFALRGGGHNPVPPRAAVQEATTPPAKAPEPPPPEPAAAPPAPQPEAAPKEQAAAPQPAPAQTAAPPSPAVQAAAPEPKKPVPVPASASAAGTLSLTIEATEAAWVQVRADKTPAVQRLMQAGEKLTTEARDRITVDLGNAGGVQITFQGQSLGSPGKRGEVIHLVYPEGKRIEKKKPEEPKPAAEPVSPQQ